MQLVEIDRGDFQTIMVIELTCLGQFRDEEGEPLVLNNMWQQRGKRLVRESGLDEGFSLVDAECIQTIPVMGWNGEYKGKLKQRYKLVFENQRVVRCPV